MASSKSPPLKRRVSDFCRQRLAAALPPRDLERIEIFLVGLVMRHEWPPKRGKSFDWPAIGAGCQIDLDQLHPLRGAIIPVLATIIREIPKPSPATKARRVPVRKKNPAPARTQHVVGGYTPDDPSPEPRRRGYRPRPVVEFPEALFDVWDEPETFAEALDLQMRRHGDTNYSLHKAVVSPQEVFDRTTIGSWRRGQKAPRTTGSMAVVRRIERRYKLSAGYLKGKLPHPARSAVGHRVDGIGPAERRRLAWHLPDDFDQRPAAEREEILEWVRRVVVSGSTDYRRYQAAASKTRFGIRFRNLGLSSSRPAEDAIDRDPTAQLGRLQASDALEAEMAALLRFKTSTLTEIGYQRSGVWGQETAAQKVEHLGLLFGALVAAPHGPVRGYGASLGDVTFGLLVFPAIWDWYVQWRERRRGFYTAWEVDMLSVGLAMVRKDTGWIRQTPELAKRLRPIRGLVSQADIDKVRCDWDEACDQLYKHARARAKEIQRVARVHRDPFEPILPVLEADSPVGEYRKITEEILRLMPDRHLYPLAAAEAVRAFLMLRLGLHLGLRQKNLRELMLCPPGQLPMSDRQLEEMKRGELRWSNRDQGWEVLIPSAAFKNSGSSFFANRPYRLVLPDLGNLYLHLEAYIEIHRGRLLRSAPDPGTLFVKTAKASSKDAAYDQCTFYEAWRWAIQRFGILNPYTGRGAIAGLLPHGPHNVRDVLATHVLKKTGSYEQASYAIQDTPDTVAKHYGRFLPQDKAALAAEVLNRAWAT